MIGVENDDKERNEIGKSKMKLKNDLETIKIKQLTLKMIACGPCQARLRLRGDLFRGPAGGVRGRRRAAGPSGHERGARVHRSAKRVPPSRVHRSLGGFPPG